MRASLTEPVRQEAPRSPVATGRGRGTTPQAQPDHCRGSSVPPRVLRSSCKQLCCAGEVTSQQQQQVFPAVLRRWWSPGRPTAAQAPPRGGGRLRREPGPAKGDGLRVSPVLLVRLRTTCVSVAVTRARPGLTRSARGRLGGECVR